METQQQVQELKAERVQEEIAAADEPFRLSLKAERVQEPVAVRAPISEQAGGTVSLAYEMSFNQMKGATVAVELNEPQIVVRFFTTGGPAAA